VNNPKTVERPFVSVQQKKRKFIVTCLPAADLTEISYVSVRGRDTEEGAVQRVLNPLRIVSLRDYALAGGDYSASIVLNWVNKDSAPVYEDSKVKLPIQSKAAQIIDGQHRVEGLREAIKQDSSVGEIDIPVAIYSFLETQACADIFLAINNEQKPVPKSLVIDLYGIASQTLVDPASVRARDIASFLNTDEESPYLNLIRFPGAARSQIGVDLSTVTTAIKPLVEEKGALDAVGITEFEIQKRVLTNFLNVLKSWYGHAWGAKDNVFLSAAGFTGATDFFRNKLVPYCNVNRNYTLEFMTAAMKLDKDYLVKRSDLKGLQGRNAARQVTDSLTERFLPSSQSQDDIKF
jgi:DNA sulfur modification protein DndB